jgi:hypothetical protein
MSGRYTFEEREMIIKIKDILAGYIGVSKAKAQTIPLTKEFEDMMSSVVAMKFIQDVRNQFEMEICWGRISDNPTIEGLMEVIIDEKDNGYKCNSGK